METNNSSSDDNGHINNNNNNNYVLVCNKIDSLLQKQLTRVEMNTFNCTVEELSYTISELFHLNRGSFGKLFFFA